MGNYKEWFMSQWTLRGGLITQVQAARILGKTPTRIRQMINEKKINQYCFDDEAPLVSLTEILNLYEVEYQLHAEIEHEKNRAAYEEYQEKQEAEHQEYLDSLSSEELEQIKAKEIYQKRIKKKYKVLQHKKDAIEEEMVKLNNELEQ